MEAKRTNGLFSDGPYIVYSQMLGNNSTRADPHKGETGQYSENIWEKEMLHNTNTKCLVDPKADYRNLLEQEPVNITKADVIIT